MDMKLRDKTAIVTGGSRGLGRAICEGLAAEGARVVINCIHSIDKAKRLAEEIEANHGVAALAVQADASKLEDIRRLFDETEEAFGPVDILVNNAAVWPAAFVTDMTAEDWRETMRVNLTGPFLACREAVRRWTGAGRRGGRIINITSQAAFNGSTTGHAHYAASKGALVTFTISLAREVAADGILVNALAPGMMWTDMAKEALEKNADHYLARIPLGRAADPAEIASSVTFLASEQASYITGTTASVTGGMLMR